MSERRLHIPDRIRETMRGPDWYNRLSRLRGGLMLGSLAASNVAELAGGKGDARTRANRLLVRVVEEPMLEDAVTLGDTGPNWDGERQPVDTVVMHHTGSAEPTRLSRLNALHLLRLYVPKYRNPGEDAGSIGGRPIYSGHTDAQGDQVFYGYHWLIRRDGNREHLLPDEAIGWHAGNWSVNCSSVAVCFDDDLEHASPTDEAFQSAAGLVSGKYPQVDSKRIIGHNAIVQTICPGSEFDVWGARLRALVEDR